GFVVPKKEKEWEIEVAGKGVKRLGKGMLLKIGSDEGRLSLKFLTIRDKLRELGGGYIFAKTKRSATHLSEGVLCKLEHTSFGESIKVKIRGQVARFTYKRFNAFLGTPAVDLSVVLYLT
ncbi:hypothetical protein HAX54_042180, partial [Datura stramonium]|nr:hypothetical protein [Datura stramonium]